MSRSGRRIAGEMVSSSSKSSCAAGILCKGSASSGRQQARPSQDRYAAHYCVLVITAPDLDACHLPLDACSKADTCRDTKGVWLG